MKKLLLMLLAGLWPMVAQAEAKKRPNVVIIMADDKYYSPAGNRP